MNCTVYAYRTDQLGSALNNLANGWRFAERIGARFVCFWLSEHHRRGRLPFQEMFDPDPRIEVIDARPDFDAATLDLLRGINVAEAMAQGVDPACLAGRSEIAYTATGPLFLRGETREVAVAGARGLLRSLSLNGAVRDALEAIKSVVDVGSRVALHLRGRDSIVVPMRDITDLADNERAALIAGYARVAVPISTFRRAGEAIAPDSDLFVFSNKPEWRQEAVRLFSDRDVATMDRHASALVGLSSVQRDLLEQLLMAEMRAIIGPPSNFSGVAQILGGLSFYDVQGWLDPGETLTLIRRDLSGSEVGQTFIPEVIREFSRRMLKIGRPKAAKVFQLTLESPGGGLGC